MVVTNNLLDLPPPSPPKPKTYMKKKGIFVYTLCGRQNWYDFFSLNDKLTIHVNLKCISLLTKYFASKNLPEEGSNY